MKKDLRKDISAFAESVLFNSTFAGSSATTIDHPNLQVKVKH